MATAGYGNSIVRGGSVTSPPTIQTNPLDPVFSGVPVVIEQGYLVNPTWNKWFVDLREKVNVINSTLAAWSGITPVTGLTPGTYGDATHYPKVTVNEFGLITAIATQSISGGGGNPMHVTTVTGTYTVALSDVPNSSSNIGMIVANSASPNVINVDTFANTGIPVGTDLNVLQRGGGATSLQALTGVSFIGPTITGGGQYALGRAIQIATDVWAISGNLTWATSSAPDPYWANVVSLLYFNGTSGSKTITDETGRVWSSAGTNASISILQSKFGGSSLYNSGTSGYVASTTSVSGITPGTSDFTEEIFCYATGTSGYLWQISNSTNGLYWNGSTLQWSDGLSWHYTTLNLPTNQWVHLAVVRASNSLVIYVNGVGNTATTVTASLASPTTLTVGSSGSGGQSFVGYLASFRLTQGIARYTANFTPPTVQFPNHG